MAIILLIMTAFVVANLIIGYMSGRKATTESLMVAARKMGLATLIFSTFTTSIGAGDILSYPALAYEQGWSALHFVVAMPVVVILMAFTVGKRYHEMNVKTISDVMCKVYGEGTALRTISSICMTMGLLAWVAGQYAAFGKTLELLTGAPAVVGMIIGSVVFIFYTVAGGLLSVMAVSIIQGIVLIVGVVMIFFATDAAGGGFMAIQSSLPASYHSFLGAAGGMTVTMFWMNKGLSRFTNFAYWQRIGAAKNSKVGIWGVSLGMAVTAIIGVVLAAIGMASFKINPNMADPEMIFVESAVLYFPRWVGGLMLGALWAAILSSAGGFLNSSATLIGNDIWFSRKNKQDLTEAQRVRQFRILTSVIGGVTFFIALALPSVLSSLVWAGVWLTPPLIPVLYATIFDKEGKRVNKNWVIATMLISLVVGTLFEMVPSLAGFASGGTIPAFLVSLTIMLIGTAVCSQKPSQIVTK